MTSPQPNKPTKGPIDQAPPKIFNMAAYCLGRSSHRPKAKIALQVYTNIEQGEPSETWTYAQLEDAVLGIAAALQDKGLQPGARIAIRLENTSTYALLFFGAIAGGFIPLPMSSQLTASEASFLINDSEAKALAINEHLPVEHLPNGLLLFSEPEVKAMIQHPRRAEFAKTNANDPAYLIYTSGTTAKPKGVLHAQRAAWGRRPMYKGWYDITPSDRMMHAGSFNWTYTLGTGLTDPWANGATSIIYTGPKDPSVWPRLIVKSNATMFAAVPGLFRQILKYTNLAPGDLNALRHGLIAGEAPKPSLFDDWQKATGTPLYEAIGMSEISTYISSSPSVPRKQGKIGKPQPGRRVAILPLEDGTQPLPPNTQGLLAVHRSDPGLMLGYWNRPQEERDVFKGEWFTGGDLAMIDAEGYVAHMGRANDIMKALGYRVAPQEIEAVLSKHQSVSEVACTELKVRNDVSVIGAYIVLNEGFEPDRTALEKYAKANLAQYKCPREYRFVDHLPRTSNGKIKRNQLTAIGNSNVTTA